MTLRVAACLALLPLGVGCATWPEDRLASCSTAAHTPLVERLNDGRLGIRLSVFIYNVEGLPWPARKGRGPFLDRIGDQLAAMRAEGRAPDIVLLQEAFTARSARIAERGGYPTALRGPGRKDIARTATAAPAFVAERNRKKGEVKVKLLGSGLYVMSDLPVQRVYRQGFARYSCAGFDCLSAKGIMLVRVTVSGAPTAIDIATTHLNSGRASRVSSDRSGEAHGYQATEAAAFLDRVRDLRNPLIFGGDFNMRRNPERFDFFTTQHPYEIVHRRCLRDPGCRILMSVDGDEPWMDTQDLQAFQSGNLVKVEPIQAETLFDGPRTGGKLSDHDGFLVAYRLSWPADAQALTETCIGRAQSTK